MKNLGVEVKEIEAAEIWNSNGTAAAIEWDTTSPAKKRGVEVPGIMSFVAAQKAP